MKFIKTENDEQNPTTGENQKKGNNDRKRKSLAHESEEHKTERLEKMKRHKREMAHNEEAETKAERNLKKKLYHRRHRLEQIKMRQI